MARLNGCSFGLDSTTLEWGAIGTDSAAVSTTIIRHAGGRSLQIGGATTLVTGVRRGVAHDFAAAAADGPFFARGYLYVVTRPSAENAICALTSAGVAIIWVTMDSGGLLRLYDEDGVIGSASAAIPLNVWAPRIAFMVNRTAAAGSHVVRAYLDGVEFAGAANRSLSVGLSGIRFGGNMNAEAQTQGEWYWTDLAINDSTAGGDQTDLPGHCDGVRYWRPTAAGDAAATAGTFASIDESPPNDATDFIEIDTNIPANYKGPDWATMGGASSDRIVLIQVGERQRAETAASCGWTVQIKSQSGGTAQTGTAKTQTDTTWRTDGHGAPRNPSLTSYVDPQAGGPWTPALIAGIVAGVDVTDAAPDVHITALWAKIEFICQPIQPLLVSTAVQRAANW